MACLQPTSVKWLVHTWDNTQAVVVFPEVLMKRLQLFRQTCMAQALRLSLSPVQCDQCHRFHNSRACQGSPCCCTCAASALTADHKCPAIAKCANCLGPHQATDLRCPVCPCRLKDRTISCLDPDQLKSVWAMGCQAHQAKLLTAQAQQGTLPGQ